MGVRLSGSEAKWERGQVGAGLSASGAKWERGQMHGLVGIEESRLGNKSSEAKWE